MKSFPIVLVTLVFSFSAVKAGGDTFSNFLPQNFLHARAFDYDGEEKPMIFLPRCRLDDKGNPTKELTGNCEGRCRRTKIIFKPQLPNEEDSCCCVSWDKSKHSNIKE